MAASFTPRYDTITVRSLKHDNKDAFIDQLSKVNWDPVLTCLDMDYKMRKTKIYIYFFVVLLKK